MVVEFVKSVSHKCETPEKKNYSDQDIKKVIMELMERNNIDTSNVRFDENGKIQVIGEPNLKFHSLMLEVERMGLATKCIKTTSYEITS